MGLFLGTKTRWLITTAVLLLVGVPLVYYNRGSEGLSDLAVVGLIMCFFGVTMACTFMWRDDYPRATDPGARGRGD